MKKIAIATLGCKVNQYESAAFASAFAQQGCQLVPHHVDDEGLVLGPESASCQFFYVTPSHQAPTGVLMSNARRQALLQQAMRHNQILIEDDYDSETNIETHPKPALKAHDQHGRVIYVGSLSKALQSVAR